MTTAFNKPETKGYGSIQLGTKFGSGGVKDSESQQYQYAFDFADSEYLSRGLKQTKRFEIVHYVWYFFGTVLLIGSIALLFSENVSENTAIILNTMKLKRIYLSSTSFDWSTSSASINSTSTTSWTGLAASPWKIYKRTVNANNGTNTDILDDFVYKYIAYGHTVSLGCNTNKLVGVPYQNNYTCGEFHSVDSDVFTDSTDQSVEDWNAMITDLGLDEYHVHMNGFQQFYVPDLSPNLLAIQTNGFTEYFTRLSSTPGTASTGVLNVAHLILYCSYTGAFYDIVCPAVALSDDELTTFGFQEWTADECAGAHQLKWELEDYADLVEISTTDYDLWEIETGLTTPLFIGIGIPVTSLSKVDDIFTMVGTITNMTETTVVYDTCSYRELVVDAAYDDTTTNVTSTIVRYIRHDDATDGPSGYTLADWEDLHDTIYDAQIVKAEAGDAQWSRYLDNHIGIESPSTEDCDTSMAIVGLAYDAVDSEYVVSTRAYIHYYTGVPGVVSWEFNAAECSDELDDQVCGCLDCNSATTYLAEYNTTCV